MLCAWCEIVVSEMSDTNDCDVEWLDSNKEPLQGTLCTILLLVLTGINHQSFLQELISVSVIVLCHMNCPTIKEDNILACNLMKGVPLVHAGRDCQGPSSDISTEKQKRVVTGGEANTNVLLCCLSDCV